MPAPWRATSPGPKTWSRTPIASRVDIFLAAGTMRFATAILGALSLYLSLVNLLQILLGLTGQREEYHP